MARERPHMTSPVRRVKRGLGSTAENLKMEKAWRGDLMPPGNLVSTKPVYKLKQQPVIQPRSILAQLRILSTKKNPSVQPKKTHHHIFYPHKQPPKSWVAASPSRSRRSTPLHPPMQHHLTLLNTAEPSSKK